MTALRLCLAWCLLKGARILTRAAAIVVPELRRAS